MFYFWVEAVIADRRFGEASLGYCSGFDYEEVTGTRGQSKYHYCGLRVGEC